jgi:prepilin-type N-terminal cleavage/methylation domain-containing protein/prepilin-type processing-associated H-X9-DG protein
MHRAAFTLIEVMVVVVIVGMLAAIIFPVFAKARGAAMKTSCVSNLKELALASMIYEQDHDETIFPYGYNLGPKYLTWWGDLMTGDAEDGLLYPYTKSNRIRGCPSALNLPTGTPHTYTMGYGVNFRLFYNYPPNSPPFGFIAIGLSEVEEPTQTVFMADSARWDTEQKLAVGTAWLIGDSWYTHLHGRHVGDMANVAWMDGHVNSEHISFPIVDQGNSPFWVSAEDLKANKLGDLLRFPRENPYSAVPSIRDQYYYLLRKPSM